MSDRSDFELTIHPSPPPSPLLSSVIHYSLMPALVIFPRLTLAQVSSNENLHLELISHLHSPPTDHSFSSLLPLGVDPDDPRTGPSFDPRSSSRSLLRLVGGNGSSPIQIGQGYFL